MIVTIIVTLIISLSIMITTAIADKKMQIPNYEYVIVKSASDKIAKLFLCIFCIVLLLIDLLLALYGSRIEGIVIFYALGLLFDLPVLFFCIMDCGSYVAFDGDETIIIHNCFTHKKVNASSIKRIFCSKGSINFMIADEQGKFRSLFSISASAKDSADFVHAVDAIAKTPDN